MPENHHHHHHYYARDRHGYPYRQGQPGPGPNRHRLRRDTENGVIAGVCAGFAQYYGWSLGWTRVITVILTMFFFPFPLLAYVFAAFVLKREKGEAVFRDPEQERFWRTFSTRPRVTFSELKHRFRALDARLADLETAVTSEEYGLRKAFRDLERGT